MMLSSPAAQKFAWLMRKGLICCSIATGFHLLGLSFAWRCWHLDRKLTRKGRCLWVVLFLWGIWLSAEGQGAAFHFLTSHLGASVVLVGDLPTSAFTTRNLGKHRYTVSRLCHLVQLTVCTASWGCREWFAGFLWSVWSWLQQISLTISF